MRENLQEKIIETQNKINELLQNFHDETGLKPDSIDFEIFDLMSYQDNENCLKKYVISNTKILASV